MHQVLDEGAREHDAHVEAVAARGLVAPCAARLRVGRPQSALATQAASRLAVHGHVAGMPVACALAPTRAAGLERVAPGHAHVAVRLLVVDEHVARELALRPSGLDLRRRHDVELADLRRAREHLDRVGVVRDLERLGGEDAAAAEGARLEARHARLEARLGRGAALLVGEVGGWALGVGARVRAAGRGRGPNLVRELGLGRERHVEQHLRRQSQHVRRDAVARHACTRK